MSYLDDIISETISKRRHEEEWSVLHNSYFRGEDGFKNLETWAQENNLKIDTYTYLDTKGKEQKRIIFSLL